MTRPTNVCKAVVVVSALSTSIFAGCAPVDDAQRFREPIPAQEQVALGVPGHGSTTKTQGLTVMTEGVGTDATAQYYAFTRTIATGVDAITAVILGGIWVMVNTPPTSIDSKKAVWGPSTPNGLESAIWRFSVTEVGDAEYNYVLEGQPKTGGTWLSILTGHGYGKTRPEHNQGWFQADNDAYKKLEPVLGHDQGTTKITYDLRTLPATLAVELRPGGTEGSLDIVVTHDALGAGSVSIKGTTDLDASKVTKLEDVDLLSQWESNGSGRADVVFKGGDLPVTVDATECWSSSFARVYYQDTVNFEPESGSSQQCSIAQKP